MRVAPQENGIERTHTHTKLHGKTRQLAKSVKAGINNPSPQMPSIVPCLDKVSKSGWKMRAPFLCVELLSLCFESGSFVFHFICACMCVRVCVCACVQ